MSGHIFISYRRKDSPGSAGRLRDRLSVRFAQSQIFIDVDNIPPGADLVEAIEKSVSSCDALIALIGRQWLTAHDEERRRWFEKGRRWLENLQDHVRLEIATALKRDIAVIPVLLDGASMPSASQLPDDLKPLARRKAIGISPDRFWADAERLIGTVERAMESARLDEWLAEAHRYLDDKDYAKALPSLRQAAAAGSTYAMVNLGSMYGQGWGVAQDYAQARQWFQKAAAAGNTGGMFNLGCLHENGWGVAQDYSQARHWYQKAAAAGNAKAMMNLACLYQNGWGVAQDEAQARHWCQKAAAAGNSKAMFKMGWLYEKGWGVAQDEAQSRHWYRKAAEAGNMTAKVLLMFQRPKQVKKSPREGREPS